MDHSGLHWKNLPLLSLYHNNQFSMGTTIIQQTGNQNQKNQRNLDASLDTIFLLKFLECIYKAAFPCRE